MNIAFTAEYEPLIYAPQCQVVTVIIKLHIIFRIWMQQLMCEFFDSISAQF